MNPSDTRLLESSQIEGDFGPELNPRLERLSAQRSAWGVLAPSGLCENGHEIAQSGLAVSEYFHELAKSQDQLDVARLAGIDALIDEFECSIRLAASRVPLRKLRATLPDYLENDPQGLLNLLDILIGENPEAHPTLSDRIYAIDYLITLLCSSDDVHGGAIQHDPVTITPRVRALCEQSNAAGGIALTDAAATFFEAANMNSEDLRQESNLRALRARKAELGIGFFAPTVLRAIVTYNVALNTRAADAIIESNRSGLPKARKAQRSAPVSVYESSELRAIAGAIRRRIQGDNPKPEPTDRIAWSLDFDDLIRHETMALSHESAATPEGPLGTAIIVGLISRSLAVLSMDLQDVGISPDELANEWVAELAEDFQRYINESLTNDNYHASCVFSDAKLKFLSAPVSDQLREKRRTSTPTKPKTDLLDWDTPNEKRESASALVRDALDERDRELNRPAAWLFGEGGIPWRLLGQATIVLAMLVAVGSILQSQVNRDLLRWSHDQLASVSPYLEQGRRNGSGLGPAFVGRIADEWLALEPADREALAADMVLRLQEQGVQQVMIYDDDHTLRIQAIGSQPVRTL